MTHQLSHPPQRHSPDGAVGGAPSPAASGPAPAWPSGTHEQPVDAGDVRLPASTGVPPAAGASEPPPAPAAHAPRTTHASGTLDQPPADTRPSAGGVGPAVPVDAADPSAAHGTVEGAAGVTPPPPPGAPAAPAYGDRFDTTTAAGYYPALWHLDPEGEWVWEWTELGGQPLLWGHRFLRAGRHAGSTVGLFIGSDHAAYEVISADCVSVQHESAPHLSAALRYLAEVLQ